MSYLSIILTIIFLMFSYQNCVVEQKEDGTTVIKEDIPNKVLSEAYKPDRLSFRDYRPSSYGEVILNLNDETVEPGQALEVPWQEIKELLSDAQICAGGFSLETEIQEENTQCTAMCALSLELKISSMDVENGIFWLTEYKSEEKQSSCSHQCIPKPKEQKYLCDREENNRLIEIIESLANY